MIDKKIKKSNKKKTRKKNINSSIVSSSRTWSPFKPFSCCTCAFVFSLDLVVDAYHYYELPCQIVFQSLSTGCHHWCHPVWIGAIGCVHWILLTVFADDLSFFSSNKSRPAWMSNKRSKQDIKLLKNFPNAWNLSVDCLLRFELDDLSMDCHFSCNKYRATILISKQSLYRVLYLKKLI